RHEGIQAIASAGGQSVAGLIGKHTCVCQGSQVKDLVANGDARTKCLGAALWTEHAEWQVLDGKAIIGPVGRSDPALQCRIVGFIQVRHKGFLCWLQGLRGSKCLRNPAQASSYPLCRVAEDSAASVG